MNEVDPATTRWKVIVEYHGAGFAGWQVQPDARTVQGELEAAVERVVGHRVQLSASGRTDAGVHALGQVVSFVTTARRSARAIRDGLTACLPPDIACVRAEEVPLSFDPRRWTRQKLYRYTWLARRSRSPMWADRAWHVRDTLDVAAMHAAAQHMVGQHDFTSFRAEGCGADHAVRTVESASVRWRAGFVELDVSGNGFLRHMVRIAAGTLWEVGRGAQPVGWVAEVIEAKRREAAGRTAPAHGLTLVSVSYGDAPPAHMS